MKIAIMQPYVLPYIGYFQMISAVDKFVFYDDVNFIKKGWINRNKILVNNKDFTFSIPLTKISQNVSINKTDINLDRFEEWKQKFVQTLKFNYKKAPHFVAVNAQIENLLATDSKTISQFAIESVITISKYLEINTEFLVSSERYDNKHLERQERLIDICEQENATHYINALGGQDLYSKDSFMRKGVQLNFIKTLPISYEQFKDEFVPWLSIIDVLMFNSVEEVRNLLDQYDLV